MSTFRMYEIIHWELIFGSCEPIPRTPIDSPDPTYGPYHFGELEPI
jgi:hypothetical protein